MNENSFFDDYNSRKAKNTLITHRTGLKRFAEFLASAGIADPDDIDSKAERLQHDPHEWRDITHDLIFGFREWMKIQGDAIKTLNVRLSCVKTYAKLAFIADMIDEKEHLKINLITGYSRQEGKRIDEHRDQTRRGRKKAEHVSLSDQQAERLKMQPDTPQGRRDRLLMCIMLDHGLRCGEVKALTVGAFNLTDKTMTFYRAKVDRTDTHELSDDTAAALRAYINYGDAPLMDDQPLLRSSQKGGKLTDPGMSEQSITRRVKVLGAEIGIDGLSAHDCRHYWATSANKEDFFRFLYEGGWASAVSAQMYVHYDNQ